MGMGCVRITKDNYEIPWDDRVEILANLITETDAKYFIDQYGDSLEEDYGADWDFGGDFVQLSRGYPNILFSVYWEQDNGYIEDAVYYFMNGLWYSADVVKVYPSFQPGRLRNGGNP